MSEYHDSQLTAFGADLAQRASNGDTKFTITKATSTADDLSQTDLSQLITLPHEKQTGEIDRILPDPNGGTKVKGTKVSFDNLNLTESYPIQAMALYAKEDVDGAKEQLYAVTTAADPETMPKSDSAVMFTFSASIYVIVGNASQVTINVNPDSFATKEYVADAIANVKVDTSDLAKLSQDNYYTGDNQFKYDPVNKDGDAYGLAKNIDTKVTDNADGTITVNGKTYTPADDSKVVHTSGDEEIAGTKTFDTAPIDKTTGNPYITAKAPGIPKLAVTYNATSKAFDYTLTAPEKDGLSDIIQYNLLWKDHSVDDWTTVIVKPDALTGQLTGVDIPKTYDFKAAAQNAVGSSDSTDVITVPTVDGNIYGASWDGSPSGTLQRTDAAVGLKAGINGAQNDFDTLGPWGLMDKTVTDSYGNAFVWVPKFYIRKTQDKSKPLSTWQVSLVKQGADWYLPNCFYDFDTSNVKLS
ncbi:fibronectin type III domain-containing protein [Lentilactobacillus parabuchneri]|uniref:fibronectin type III domain-containing protein n=1 Tax=Lentilactobacillus parabuchneri TaxID=152331 RepID=UPI000A0F8D1B|nr:fibronectin type III domain-containing protein [Lentilactobacillus parabuchneri]ORN13295.1 hypothetical protein FAM23164_02251 [Lentilactobacillus parabuchneri]ORN18699.1 hypothetical protein FAM23166_02070 [Lentilactobacillus parabuchneri]ORN19263.1 hypothetical protein FAM23165_00069 [Lentilactobacillus parabuchneri]ORN23881.1 hypothetical protein FAM23167_02238 [Lentilactobacillus parabuchneri]